MTSYCYAHRKVNDNCAKTHGFLFLGCSIDFTDHWTDTEINCMRVHSIPSLVLPSIFTFCISSDRWRWVLNVIFTHDLWISLSIAIISPHSRVQFARSVFRNNKGGIEPHALFSQATWIGVFCLKFNVSEDRRPNCIVIVGKSDPLCFFFPSRSIRNAGLVDKTCQSCRWTSS